MCHLLWILVLMLELICGAHNKIQIKCPVSDLKLICVSSHSARFGWILKPKWTGACNNQTLRIVTKIQRHNNSQVSSEDKVNVTDMRYTVNKLLTDEDYMFEFTHYLIDSAISSQNINGTTRKPGRVQSLTTEAVNSTSAYISFIAPGRDMECVSRYYIKLCQNMSMCTNITENAENKTVTSYFPKLEPCTEYVGEVMTMDIDQGYSNAWHFRFKTKSIENRISKALWISNVTSSSFTFEWKDENIPPNCAKQFFISTWDIKGDVNETQLDYSVRKHTVYNLRPCHKYRSSLVLEDIANVSILQYNIVQEITLASDSLAVRDLKVRRVSNESISLEWSLSEDIDDCVLQYLVTVSYRDGLRKTNSTENTTNNYITFNHSPCSMETVSAQIIINGKHVNSPTILNLRKLFQDASLSLTANPHLVSTRDAWYCVKSDRFVCDTHCNISWYTDLNHRVFTRTLTVSHPNQGCVSVSDLLPCTNYTVVVKPFVGQNILTSFNETVSTKYEEPTLNMEIKQVSRGFNVSWKVSKEDTKQCLTDVKIKDRSNNKTIVKPFNASYEVLKDRVPCREYYISIQGVGINKVLTKEKSMKKVVTPERLPAPQEPTVDRITNTSASLKWELTNTTNDCHPTVFTMACKPQAGQIFPGDLRSSFITNITGLRPNENYTCTGIVRNKAGDSQPTQVSFITSEGVPSSPKNVSATAVTSSMVRILWDPPDQRNGVLVNYTVVIENHILNCNISPGCKAPGFEPVKDVVSGNTTEVLVELQPCLKFQVIVVAASKEGYGPPSTSVTSTTPSGGG